MCTQRLQTSDKVLGPLDLEVPMVVSCHVGLLEGPPVLLTAEPCLQFLQCYFNSVMSGLKWNILDKTNLFILLTEREAEQRAGLSKSPCEDKT